MSGGSTTRTEPWAEQKPYLQQGFKQAAGLYNQGPPAFYPGQTLAGFSPAQQLAQRSTMGYATGPRPAAQQAAAGGVPWGSDYAGPISALSSSNQAASDAAAFHASLTGMPNLANIATAPTIVSANPGSVWGDYMDEVETETRTDAGSLGGWDIGYT